MVNTILDTATFCAVKIPILLFSGKGLCGLIRQLKWGTNKMQLMVNRLNSGKMFDLGTHL
jgi:hypothetical protein